MNLKLPFAEAMEDEKLPKTIEDGVSSHFERAQDIDPAIEKRHVIVITSTLQSESNMILGCLESCARLTQG